MSALAHRFSPSAVLIYAVLSAACGGRQEVPEPRPKETRALDTNQLGELLRSALEAHDASPLTRYISAAGVVTAKAGCETSSTELRGATAVRAWFNENTSDWFSNAPEESAKDDDRVAGVARSEPMASSDSEGASEVDGEDYIDENQETFGVSCGDVCCEISSGAPTMCETCIASVEVCLAQNDDGQVALASVEVVDTNGVLCDEGN